MEVNDTEFTKVYRALLDIFPRLNNAQKLILSGIVNNNQVIRELAEQVVALNQPQNKFDLSEVFLTLLKANYSIELANPDLELVNHALHKALQALQEAKIIATCCFLRSAKKAEGNDQILLS